MLSRVKIAIVGDFNPEADYHRATNESLEHAARVLGITVVGDWIPTDGVPADAYPGRLERYDAVFLAPGAPYRSKAGAFAAIRFAREQGWPFFGT
jgi:CTP synthase (UTP-ammonia lyase)